MYHNTGIVVATTWVIQQVNTLGGTALAFGKSSFLLPIIFSLPVINAVLIVACAYHVYSFFCVARHFQLLRHRLTTLLGRDVLGYEDKFKRSFKGSKELSLTLDILAGVMWFVIPIGLALTVGVGLPLWVVFPNTACSVAYWVGTLLSTLAGIYLVGVVILMLRTHGGKVSI